MGSPFKVKDWLTIAWRLTGRRFRPQSGKEKQDAVHSTGRTGLQVSRLCLGTMNFGPQTSEADSFAIMDYALAQGINFIDTANAYAW